MKNEVGKFKFEIPSVTNEDGSVNKEKSHVDAGKTIEKTFSYDVCETEDEALQVLAKKEWKVLELVNNKLKSSARSNAYQNALIPYKPSEVPQEDIKERMIRDFIRMGVSEEAARNQVESLLAAK